MREGRSVWCGLVALVVTSLFGVSHGAVVAQATLPAEPIVVAVDEAVASPPRPSNLLGFACSSATQCVLATDPTASTSDSGATWRTLPGSRLLAVGCGAGRCIGIDASSNSMMSADGGGTWVAGRSLPGFSARSIACPDAQRCVAGGARQVGSDLSAALAVTDDGGATWTFRHSAPEPSGFGRVACASASFCVATGFGLAVASTDGGVTWAALPAGLGTPLSLVTTGCASPSTCVVVANGNMLRSIDGGSSWTAVASPMSSMQPGAIACPSATRCVAIGSIVGAFTFDPTSGPATAVALPPGVAVIDDVQCVGSVCMLFGRPSPVAAYAEGSFPTRVAIRSADGGSTWTRVAPPAGAVPQIRALACVDSALCVAVGDVDEIGPTARLAPVVSRSTDGGATWSAGGVPTSIERLSDVACVPGGACVATGTLSSNAARVGLARTADGGVTWSASLLDVPVASLSSLACFSGGTCLALADQVTGGSSSDWPNVVVRSNDSGATWQVAASFDQSFGQMRCASAERCLAVVIPRAPGLATIKRTVDGGSTWTPIGFPEPPVLAVAIKGCTPTRCFLVVTGSSGTPIWYRSDDLGSTWVALATSPSGGMNGDLGCFATTCIVTSDRTVIATTDEGASWTLTSPVPSETDRVTSMTCLSATRCIGVTDRSSSGGTGIVGLQVTQPPVRPVVALNPARLLETRTGPGLTTVDGQHQSVGRRPAGATYVLPVSGRGGVSAAATSAMLNVVATGAGGAGFLTVYPCDQPRPNASTVNFAAGATIANGALAKLSPAGTTCIYTSAETDLVVDVGGYSVDDVAAPVGLTPARLLETRSAPGLTTVDRIHEAVGPIAAGATYELPVARRGGVGPDASTALLNIAVTGAGADGYLTVFPCDQGKPNASSLNYAAGATIANSLVAKLSAAGSTCIFSSATTDVIVDVSGSVRSRPGALGGVTPARLWETRTGPGLTTIDGQHQATGRRAAGTTYELPVRGRGGVPSTASGVFVNVAAVTTGAPGFLTVFPCGQSRPNASSVNYAGNATIANTVLATLSPTGTICVYTSASADVIVDVVAVL